MNCTRLNEPPSTDAVRLDRERLREAGNALDQQVAAGEQAHEHALEHLLLARDHAPDLEQRLFEPLQEIGVGRDCLLICHEGLLGLGSLALRATVGEPFR